LQAVLGRLPEEQQTALTLAYYGNKTHVEITQERSARTIRSRISMAMRKLQTDLASADQRP
jgi:DNA-directed RNA polymerase specialized sigma24 family protein